jgi:hypothetical protein
MPQALTSPGVYIEEIPSGVRAIAGVPTSIAAFVGRTRSGAVDKATYVDSYADYERKFGGLSLDSTVSYAVRDFFNNGGGQAIVVRAFHATGAATAASAQAQADLAPITVNAAGPGTWGNELRVRVDYDEVPEPHLFNLTVALVRGATAKEAGTVLEREVFRNLSLRVGHVRRIDRALNASSRLLRSSAPTVADDQNTRPPASAAVSAAAPLWADNPTSTALDGGDDGAHVTAADITDPALQAARRGIYALEEVDVFNLLCIPPFERGAPLDASAIDQAVAFCTLHRAFFLIDPPSSWTSPDAVVSNRSDLGSARSHAAVYYPNLRQPDPLRDGQLDTFAPCGAIAGVLARTDAERGVWKAPAGVGAVLTGVPELEVSLTEAQIGRLNPLGINCLRTLPDVGRVIWGARTREGADALASEWKYVPVRRLTLYIEESLYRGTQWVVFEPNDEPLWSSIRLNVGAFMHSLWRQGAFQGSTAREAYEVKCDSDTTTQDDINRGIVNVLVRFAPLKPAEFVVLKIQQLAGQLQT